jgi:hypothetical protein
MTGVESGLTAGLSKPLSYGYDFISGVYFDTFPTSISGGIGYTYGNIQNSEN